MTRRALRVDGDLVVRKVDPDVQRTIERATAAAHVALVLALEPYGLSPFDIVVPDYEQVIYEDEVPIFAALARSAGWDVW